LPATLRPPGAVRDRAADAPRPPPFGRYFRDGAAWVVAAVCLTAVLHLTHTVRTYERANLDSVATLFRLGDWSDRVAVVAITEDDYAKHFGRKSPLDPALVAKLILGIQQAGAAVVGVDILTDDWPPGARKAVEKQVQIPIVWYRGVVLENGVIRRETAGSARGGLCGGPGVLRELSGVVREYEPQVLLHADNSADDSSVPSFTRVLERVYFDHSTRFCGGGGEKKAAAAERDLVPFPRAGPPLRRIPATAILVGMDDPNWAEKGKTLLDGRVVLLGGEFKDSRDYYATPFEPQAYGVDIQAGIVAADILHEQIKEPALWVFLAIDLTLGLGLVAAGWYVGGLWLLAVAAGAVVLTVVGSVFLLERFMVYASFIPVLVGVAIHFLMEHVREHRKLVGERRHAQTRSGRGARRA
jgi:CHASE2 domain